MSHLEKRRNRWYAVLTIPEDVRSEFGGKLRFVKSTETTDKRVAQSRAFALVAEWKEEIAQARGNSDESDYLREALGHRRQLEELKQEGQFVQSEAVSTVITDQAEKMAELGRSQEALRFARVSLGEETPIEPELSEWREGLHLTQKTAEQMEKDAKRMADHFGVVEAIDPESVREWAKVLMAPKEKDVAALGERTGYGYGVSSVKRCFSAARSVWHHLQETGKAPVGSEPFKLPKFVQRKESATRRNTASNSASGRSGGWVPFGPGHVVRLHQAAIDDGDNALADLIRLGMYSGARIEELCSLRVEDCTSERLKITESKTEAGVREVPVHEELIPTVERLLDESTDGYLLSSLTFNKYGDRSNAIGKRFGRLKKRLGYGKEYVFHSLRKTVVTMLEDAGVSENLTSDIVGHEKPRITYGLYSGGHSLSSKKRAVNLISYPLN